MNKTQLKEMLKISEEGYTMKTNEIYKAFIKLNDTQKVAVIEKAKKSNVDDDTIEGLQWLAALSSDKLKDRVLTELYAEEAFKNIKLSSIGE